MIPALVPDDDNRDGIALTGATQTLPEYIKGTPPTIESLRRRFDEARSGSNTSRTQSKKFRAYYDGPGQLSAENRALLFGRGQPPIWTNRVKPAVNGLLGVLEGGRRDPRGVPRNPDDDDSADICTKTLRFINDESKFNDTQIDVAENVFVEGCGAVIIEMVDDKIVPTQIRWEEFYYDLFSRRPDFKDARYMGIAKWMDAGEIMERWQIRINDIGDPMRPQDAGVFGTGFEDRGDCSNGWVDSRRRRCMLVEEYAIVDGEWKRIVYIAAGVLEYGPSPYLDSKRRPCCPIEGVSCYVDADNGRYSGVQDMVPLQDEVNSARSRNVALGNARQLVTDPQNPPMVDAAEAKREAALHDGVIPSGYSLAPTTDMQQSNLLRAQEAKAEIERMGPTPAVLGRQEASSQSGRARLVSQQAGLTELARPLGRLHGWVLRCYVQMWDRARQFWTDEMYIRVTDEIRAPEFLKVNEVVGQRPVMQPVMDEQGQMMVDPNTGQLAVQMTLEPVMKNRLADLDMDIILDQDDDTASLQQEVWGDIVQMVGQAGGPAAVFTPEFELMIEASPLADKRRVIELLKKGREEREQSQVTQLSQQVQQLTAALQQKQETSAAETAANIQDKQASSLQKTAAAHKTAAEADRTQAETYAAVGINPLAALLDNG